jgi:hypothetical protein
VSFEARHWYVFRRPDGRLTIVGLRYLHIAPREEPLASCTDVRAAAAARRLLSGELT